MPRPSGRGSLLVGVGVVVSDEQCDQIHCEQADEDEASL